jgi:hypothetical protein
MRTKKNEAAPKVAEPDAHTPRYISRRKAAQIGDVCVETIERMERRGQLTPHKLSARCVRLNLAEVLQVFQNARVAVAA